MSSNTLTDHKLLHWLTPLLVPRRLAYAKLLGGILWIVWIASLLLGPGYLDLAGQVIGTDFLQYYTAGYITRSSSVVVRPVWLIVSTLFRLRFTAMYTTF